jgi:DNA replication protein DnaC
MKGITSTEKEKPRFKFPEEVGKVTCPKCGNEDSITKAFYPEEKIINFVESEGMCFSCYRDKTAYEEHLRQQEEWKKERIERLKVMFDEDSLMNPKLKTATFENYQPTNDNLSKAKTLTKRYADNFSKDNPVSLLLIGNYGTGKSHLSVAITKELMPKNLSCIFISTPKLMTKIRSTYNKDSQYTEEQIINQLSKVDCLVLDDIGAESTKQGDGNQHTWATSKIFEIIDNRIGKHTIFTSNYEPKELQERLGGRNFSRMMESVHVIKMYGEDYRLKDFK